MFTFRTSITFAVMTFVTALAGLLIFIQFWTFRLAAGEAASARMNAASAETLGHLRKEIAEVTSIVDVLSTSSSVSFVRRSTLSHGSSSSRRRESSRMTCCAVAWSDHRSGDAASCSSSFRRACLPGASKTHQQRGDTAVKPLKRRD